MRTIILPLYWLAGVVAAVCCGFLPGAEIYLNHAPVVYETRTVVLACVLMTAQAALLMAIFQPATYSTSWGRALNASIVSFGFLFLAVAFSMHSPPAWGAYMLWTIVLFLSTCAIYCVSALCARRDRKRMYTL